MPDDPITPAIAAEVERARPRAEAEDLEPVETPSPGFPGVPCLHPVTVPSHNPLTGRMAHVCQECGDVVAAGEEARGQ